MVKKLALTIEPFAAYFLRISELFFIWIAIAMFVAMLGSNSYNILLRWLYHQGINWHQEISMMAAMWIYFAAYALISKEEGYIKISFLTDRFSYRIRRYLTLMARLLIIAFHVYLFVLTVIEIRFVSVQRTFVLEWPEYIYYIPLAVGTAAIIITEILLCIRYFGDPTGHPNCSGSQKG